MKFSIRDLFLVTVIVALALAWGLERVKVVRENQLLREILKEEHQSAVDWARDAKEREADNTALKKENEWLRAEIRDRI